MVMLYCFLCIFHLNTRATLYRKTDCVYVSLSLLHSVCFFPYSCLLHRSSFLIAYTQAAFLERGKIFYGNVVTQSISLPSFTTLLQCVLGLKERCSRAPR